MIPPIIPGLPGPLLHSPSLIAVAPLTGESIALVSHFMKATEAHIKAAGAAKAGPKVVAKALVAMNPINYQGITLAWDQSAWSRPNDVMIAWEID